MGHRPSSTAARPLGLVQPGNDWVGKRVIHEAWREVAQRRQLVDDEKQDNDAASDLRNAGRIFRRERRYNGTLALAPQNESRTTAGWVTAEWWYS